MKPLRSLKAFQVHQVNPEPSFDLAGLGQRVDGEPALANGKCLNGSYLEKSPKLAHPAPSRNFKIVCLHQETPSRQSEDLEQAPQGNPLLVERLRGRLPSLTVLEACTLFTLLNRRDTGGDTLLKCAAAETGVSEA